MGNTYVIFVISKTKTLIAVDQKFYPQDQILF